MEADNELCPFPRWAISHNSLVGLQSGTSLAMTCALTAGLGMWSAESMFSMLRGAIEALGHGVWLLADDDPKVRLHRNFSLILQDQKDEEKERAARGEPDPAELAKGLEDVRRAATDADIPQALKYPGSTEIIKTAAAATPSSVQIASLWMKFSAFAHARPWARWSLTDINRFEPLDFAGTVHSASELHVFDGFRAVEDLIDRLEWLYDERAGKHRP